MVEEKEIWHFGKKITCLIYCAKTVLTTENGEEVCDKCNHSMLMHGYTDPIKVKYTSNNASRPTFILLKKARYVCDFCHHAIQIETVKLIDKFKSVLFKS